MIPTALDTVSTVVKMHRDITEKMTKLKQQIAITKNLQELVDIGLSLKESFNYIDDLRADNNKLLDLVNKVVGALWVQQGIDEPIRTDWVTASPKLRVSVAVPSRHKNFEEYNMLMHHFGVPEEYWNTPRDIPPVVQVYWPGFVEYISTLAEEGKPMPPGVDISKTYSVYHVTYRGTKNFHDRVSGVEPTPHFEF